MNEKNKKYLDKNLSLDERKRIYKEEVIDKMMNPIKKEEFIASSFDPLSTGNEEEILAFRERKDPPEILKTNNIKPKEIREGQMIGMYESKQDLYLTFAHRCNALQEKVNALEKRLKKLEDLLIK